MTQPPSFPHQDIRVTDVSLTIFRWTGLPPVTYTRNSTGSPFTITSSLTRAPSR